ncbi:glycosyltransferase family 4 protein [Candidatus Woesearchaeota archaeon]|nr:glycosyltransferase family 4 protein [Candidatus Woesearchaeota archaeon]
MKKSGCKKESGKKRMEKPLYIAPRTHHWCIDTTGESVDAEFFLMPSMIWIKNSKIRNIVVIIPTIFNAFRLPKRDIYIVSTLTDILVVRINRILTGRKSVVVHVLFSDYYNRENHKGIKRKFMDWAAEVVDAAITPGEMLKKEIISGFDIPVEVSYHYPRDDKFYRSNADMESKDVISIGIKRGMRKGTDIFCQVADNLPRRNFYLLGNTKYLSEGFMRKISTIKNLTLPGYVDPREYVKKSTFYLLPGRYDAGPIALTEAMAAGLIPIVSNMLGGQDLARKVRDDLVIGSLKAEDYTKKLEELMQLDAKELGKLSRKARETALEWTRERGMSDFRMKFEKLITTVNARKGEKHGKTR